MKTDTSPKSASGQRREDLLQAFAEVRKRSLTISAPLSVEDQQVQSMADVSPTKWHLAHTTWFFETFILKPYTQNFRPFVPEYEMLFNSYYNGVSEQFPRGKRGTLSRPALADVLSYRARTEEVLTQAIAQLSSDALDLLELGLHHEQQHQELMLTDILHVLSQSPLAPKYHPLGLDALPDTVQVAPISATEPTFRKVSGGVISVGHQEPGFCFDNELPVHQVLLNDFEVALRPLSNQHVIDFIDAGGYQTPEFWLSDGFNWVKSSGALSPLYMQRGDDGYFSFTHRGLLPTDPNAVASHLNFFEADALARFFSARLPTEFEWEHAARNAPPESDFLVSGVWEWTSSAYLPYPGYRPKAGAVGEYNGKFMHNQMVLRGGSRLTPPGHIRQSYRNFFPSDASWQYSGVRLARDISSQ